MNALLQNIILYNSTHAEIRICPDLAFHNSLLNFSYLNLNKSYTETSINTANWFRVAAIGTAGQGQWSDPEVKVVP